MTSLIPSDGTAWTLDVEPAEQGVVLILGFDLAGAWHALQLDLDREPSRILAKRILAAGGDGTERTFPKLPEALHVD